MPRVHTLAFAIAIMFGMVGSPSLAADQDAGGGRLPPDGITVHGRWTIEVLNPDGTRHARYEFQNALVPVGAAHLASVLAKLVTPSPWSVHLGGSNGLCGNVQCILRADNGTLSVGAPDTGPNAGTLVLEGRVTVVANGSIASVSTYQVGPDTASTRQITGKALPSEIAVVNGQTIRVTVILSFS